MVAENAAYKQGERWKIHMKKRFAKTVALVVTAALTAGAPVSVMAAEEQSETVAVQEVSAPELPQGTDPKIGRAHV